MQGERLRDRVGTLRGDDASERWLPFEEADVGVRRRYGEDPATQRQDTAVAQERCRASREIERRPGVRGQIRSGLVAASVEDAEASLRVHDPPYRLLEPGARQRTRADRVCDKAVPLELRALVEAEQEVIRACLERTQPGRGLARSEEHTSELQSPYDLVCRLLHEK